MDFQLPSWIVVSGGAVAAIGVFMQNLLTIRKLRMENQILLGKLSEEKRNISIPTAKEVAKYGSGRGLNEKVENHPLLVVLPLVVAGVLAGYSFGQTFKTEPLLAELRAVQGEKSDAIDKLTQSEREKDRLMTERALASAEIVRLDDLIFKFIYCYNQEGSLNCLIVVINEGPDKAIKISPATAVIGKAGDTHVLASSSFPNNEAKLSMGEPIAFVLSFDYQDSERRVPLLRIRLEGDSVEFHNVKVY